VGGTLLLVLGSGVCAARDELNDYDVMLAVETKLILNDAVPAHKIDIAVDDGIVTLSGYADTYYGKRKAEEIAESVKGVLAVVNEIDVSPYTRTAREIQNDIVLALAQNPVTEFYEIAIQVSDGVVTLSGEVDSYAERQVAEEIADDVKGVRDVRNLIRYDVVTDRPDSDIAADIQYRLRAEASIDSALVTVSVDQGRVTLAGKVASSVEKTEAAAEAWVVPGVKTLTNNIQVDWQAVEGTSDWEQGWTDTDTQQAIEGALLSNPWVNPYNVITTVDDGVATLTGIVDNLRAKRAAEAEAQDTLGIWRVRNYLRVRPSASRNDQEIAQDIRDALRRDPHVDRFAIDVSVYSGKAFLAGEVDSRFMKQQAEEVAARVPGLVAIQNNLDVQYQVPAKTDREIKDDIESQLFWSPFVDGDDITVEVQAGVATLTGTVEDWDELLAAKENAREGGATSVITQLDLENGSTAD
jgi:osmotically-inducible protein OsmY